VSNANHRIFALHLAKHSPLKHLSHGQLQATDDVDVKIDKELERRASGDDVQIANYFRHGDVKAAPLNEQQFCTTTSSKKRDFFCKKKKKERRKQQQRQN
jgi:hypothetical protein